MQRRTWLRHGLQAAGAVAAPWIGSSAWAAEPGVSGNQVRIGCSLALSGILAGAGSDHVAGIQAAFKAANASGGVAGRELTLAVLDDAYVPARTAENVKRLIAEQQTFALISVMGTGNTAAVLPAVEQAAIPLVGPVTGAASLRQSTLRQVFHVRASYRDETTRLLQQMADWGIRSVAVVHLDNPFGKEVLADAQAAFAARGLSLSGSYALAADGSNGAALAQQVRDARPAAVYLGTTGTANTAFLAPLRKLTTSLPVAGLSVALVSSELAKLGPATAGVAIATVFPDANSERLPMVRSFQAAMRASGAADRIGGSSLEGWINAQVLIEGLRKAGADLRRDKLRSALTAMRRLDLGDFSLGYGAQAPFVASQFVGMAVLGANGKRLSSAPVGRLA